VHTTGVHHVPLPTCDFSSFCHFWPPGSYSSLVS
jgi:hypothetical protein